MPINTDNFNLSEVQSALQALSRGKAAGCDDVPPDFWKTLAQNEVAMDVLLELCQACWAKSDIPDKWRVATVALLYKKGDSSLPANYRPIALLPAQPLSQVAATIALALKITVSPYAYRKNPSPKQCKTPATLQVTSANGTSTDFAGPARPS